MLHIRPATRADIPEIAAIYADAVAHGTASFELEPPDEAEMARRQQALLAAGYPYLAAELDGTLAGYAYAAAFRTRPAYQWTVEDSVYVAPDRHRRGVGRALLERLIAAAAGVGFRQMIAVIGDSPLQGPSIGLHTALGFRLVGTLDAVGFKHERWLDSVLMQRALGPDPTGKPEGFSPQPR
jgi:phosphinothricin acetyltransferase